MALTACFRLLKVLKCSAVSRKILNSSIIQTTFLCSFVQKLQKTFVIDLFCLFSFSIQHPDPPNSPSDLSIFFVPPTITSLRHFRWPLAIRSEDTSFWLVFAVVFSVTAAMSFVRLLRHCSVTLFSGN